MCDLAGIERIEAFMDQDLQVMMSSVARLGELSEAEARRIVEDVYDDGIASRGEAEALFLLNDTLTASDPVWAPRFSTAVQDYVLTREPPENQVTQDQTDWLTAQIAPHGEAVSLNEIDLLLAILHTAQIAPVSLSRYTLQAISARIKTDGRARPEMTERMRKALYTVSGEGGIWVTRFEATSLFETNDAIAFARNDPAWNDLFARAIGNHLMARAHPEPHTEVEALSRQVWLQDNRADAGNFLSRMGGSFLTRNWFETVTYNPEKAARARQIADDAARQEAENITADEHNWFMQRLGWNQKVSPAERALVDFLEAEAPGFTHGLTAAA